MKPKKTHDIWDISPDEKCGLCSVRELLEIACMLPNKKQKYRPIDSNKFNKILDRIHYLRPDISVSDPDVRIFKLLLDTNVEDLSCLIHLDLYQRVHDNLLYIILPEKDRRDVAKEMLLNLQKDFLGELSEKDRRDVAKEMFLKLYKYSFGESSDEKPKEVHQIQNEVIEKFSEEMEKNPDLYYALPLSSKGHIESSESEWELLNKIRKEGRENDVFIYCPNEIYFE